MEFSREEDTNNFRIPTVTELLEHEDVESLAEYPPLLQVPFVEAVKITRPSAVILLSGKVFSNLVTSVCKRILKYGYYCNPVNALR